MVHINKQASTTEASEVLQTLLPNLETKVTSVQLPAVVTTQKVTSNLSGEESTETSQEKLPFRATVKIDIQTPKKILEALGIRNTPRKSPEVFITDRDGEFSAMIESYYAGTDYRLETERVLDYQIKEGDEISPDCYAEEDKDIYRTESSYVGYPCIESERSHIDLGDENFNLLYVSLRNEYAKERQASETPEGESKVAQLIKYLESQYPEAVSQAVAWMDNKATEQITRLQDEAKDLSQYFAEYRALRFPSMRYEQHP